MTIVFGSSEANAILEKDRPLRRGEVYAAALECIAAIIEAEREEEPHA